MTNAVATPDQVGGEAMMAALAAGLAPHLATAFKATGFKHDASGTPITTGFSHGPGGNFSYPGVDMDVFHTVVGNRGILGMLPTVASVDTNPLYAVLTGVKDDTGDEPDAPCDDAPVAGLMKGGMITSVFGRYSRQTPEMDITRLGQRVNRADPMDLRLVGSPIQQSGVFDVGPGGVDGTAGILDNEIRRKFWELSTSIHRLLSVQAWQGNPANNNAGGGYKEMTGIDALVTTGYVDAETGTALPSVDSLVRDANYLSVNADGSSLVQTVSYIYRYLRDLAFRTGVDPVRWVIAMRPEMFWEITNVWPCAYLTYRCDLSGNARLNIEGTEQVRMRDAMRAGRYLLIDGEQVEVVLDDGIAYTNDTTDGNVTSGCQASGIYFLPMSVVGGRSVLYFEHMDYNNPSIASALAGSNMALARVEGPWITVPRQTNFCIQWQTLIEPRLVLRTPWLAAKLENIMYCPEINTRQPFPNDPYFVNGGLVERAGPSFYTPSLWQ